VKKANINLFSHRSVTDTHFVDDRQAPVSARLQPNNIGLISSKNVTIPGTSYNLASWNNNLKHTTPPKVVKKLLILKQSSNNPVTGKTESNGDIGVSARSLAVEVTSNNPNYDNFVTALSTAQKP